MEEYEGTIDEDYYDYYTLEGEQDQFGDIDVLSKEEYIKINDPRTLI